jgi:hypothetical protein
MTDSKVAGAMCTLQQSYKYQSQNIIQTAGPYLSSPMDEDSGVYFT